MLFSQHRKICEFSISAIYIPIVVIYTGILHQVAVDYYGIQLSMGDFPEKPYENNEEGYKYRIRLSFDNRNYMACKAMENGAMALERKANFFFTSTKGNNLHQESLPELSSSIWLQLFPFCLVFRSDLKIIVAGSQLKQMLSRRKLIGQILPDVAKLRRPRLNLTWDNVTSF